MSRRSLSAAFPHTVPVLMGYLAIGIVFGWMLASIGYNALWAFFMSLTIYAGSGQYPGNSFRTFFISSKYSLAIFRSLLFE